MQRCNPMLTAFSLSSKVEKEVSVVVSAVAVSQRNGEARHSGMLFNTATTKVNIEKRPAVSLYLNDLLS